MGLAKKSSRLINVDGIHYRWVFSPDSGYFVVVVELADDPGQRLEVQSSSGHSDFSSNPVTPRVVDRIIREALQNGWEPAEKGRTPFSIHDNNM